MKNKLSILAGSIIITTLYASPRQANANLNALLQRSRIAKLLNTISSTGSGFLVKEGSKFRIRVTTDKNLNSHNVFFAGNNPEIKIKSKDTNKVLRYVVLTNPTQDIMLNSDEFLQIDTNSKKDKLKSFCFHVNDSGLTISSQKFNHDGKISNKSFELTHHDEPKHDKLTIRKSMNNKGEKDTEIFNLSDPNDFIKETQLNRKNILEVISISPKTKVHKRKHPSGYEVINTTNIETGAISNEELYNNKKFKSITTNPDGSKIEELHFTDGNILSREETRNNGSISSKDFFDYSGNIIANKSFVKLSTGASLDSTVDKDGRKTLYKRPNGIKHSLITTDADGKRTTIQYFNHRGKPLGEPVIFE